MTDAYFRTVIGWSLAGHIRTESSMPLGMALAKNAGRGTKQTLRSEHGTQDTSWAFRQRLRGVSARLHVLCWYNRSGAIPAPECAALSITQHGTPRQIATIDPYTTGPATGRIQSPSGGAAPSWPARGLRRSV